MNTDEENVVDPVDTGIPVPHTTPEVKDEESPKAEFYETVREDMAPAADEVALEGENADSASVERFAERVRHRAEEARGDYRAFNYQHHDTQDIVFELNDWFDLDEEDQMLIDAKREFIKEFGRHWQSCDYEKKREFIERQAEETLQQEDFYTRHCALLTLTYVAMGVYGEASTVNDHKTAVVDNCRLIWELGVFEKIIERSFDLIDIRCPSDLTQLMDPEINTDELDTELMLLLTLLYFVIETHRSNDDFSQLLYDTRFLERLVEVLGRLRWSVVGQLPVKQVLFLVWKSILCVFGDSDQLYKVKQYVRQKMDLPLKPDNVVTTSPLDYHAFRQDLISRYPSYVPPPSAVPTNLDNDQSVSHYIQVPRPSHQHTQNASLPAPTAHIATPAPSPPSSPAIAAGQKVRKSVFMMNQSFPFLYPTGEDVVPESIVEAGELFASRIRTTPAMVQLWGERDRFMKHERGWVPPDEERSPQASESVEQKLLDRVDSVYKASYVDFNSFVNVLLKVMLNSISFSDCEDINETARPKEITVKAVSAILLLLQKWFKASHILKFEYFSTLLFDSRYYLLVYKFLYSHNVLVRALFIPDFSRQAFFTQCQRLSDAALPDYGQTCVDDRTISVSEAQFVDSIETFSERYMFSIITMVRVLRKIVKSKTQRVIVVAELPSETLKKALTIYQPHLWNKVLSIFKEQVPYNGRKWKYNNMDLVSAIYLNCKPKLRDDWLVGADVTAEVEDACPQEVALRALVRFYNDRLLGIQDENSFTAQPDFFAHELQSLSVN